MKRIIINSFLKIKRALSGKGLGKIPLVVPLCQYLYKKIAPSRLTLITHRGIKIFVNPQDEGIGASLFSCGSFEDAETEIYKKALAKNMVIVDIGANMGYYSLIASEIVGDKGKIFAFEPEPNNYEILIKNIKINNSKNIFPIKKALSNKIGKEKLYVDKRNYGRNSLSEANVLDKKDSVDVETTTLDAFFTEEVNNAKVDFIKIDAEGAEGTIFEGAEEILKNKNLKILMEFSPRMLRNVGTDPLNFLEKMQSKGFKMKYIDERKKSVEILNFQKIITMCEERLDGEGALNLILEK